jgi:hypothetical protein
MPQGGKSITYFSKNLPILLANLCFASNRPIRKIEKVIGKRPIFDGRCEGSPCLWQRSDERLCPPMHSSKYFL